MVSCNTNLACVFCQVMAEEEEEADEEVESIMLDPTHEWWNLWALFRRVFRSHRFKVNTLLYNYMLREIIPKSSTSQDEKFIHSKRTICYGKAVLRIQIRIQMIRFILPDPDPYFPWIRIRIQI